MKSIKDSKGKTVYQFEDHEKQLQEYFEGLLLKSDMKEWEQILYNLMIRLREDKRKVWSEIIRKLNRDCPETKNKHLNYDWILQAFEIIED